MNSEDLLQRTLKTEFEKLSSANPRYSLRAYAKRLAVPVSALSEILNGKQKISTKRALQLVAALKIPEETAAAIRKAFEAKKSYLSQKATEDHFTELEQDQYKLISEWYYFAILSLFETEGFDGTPEVISKRLGITLEITKDALITLQRLQVLEITPEGYRLTGKQFKTSSGVYNPAIRASHTQTLDLAKTRLHQTPLERCNYSANTMAIDPDKLPEAAELITEFRRKLTAFLEKDEKKTVYRLAIQLFPLEVIES